MIIISWNVRGLNARIKKSSLRKLINSHDPSFIFIQETKISDFHPRLIRSLWKIDKLAHLHSPSMGNSGGLLSLWRENFFSMESHRIENNWIAISGSFPSLNFKGCMINVYNPCDKEDRTLVWNSLTELCLEIHMPCLLIGDFNEVLGPNERGSNLICQSGVLEFQAFIDKVRLSEIPTKNGWFTWFRGHAKSKLDRLLVNPEWIGVFPALQVSILNRSISDHCPLLVVSKERNWGPKPFRFQNCWLTHPRCMRIIREIWSESSNCNLNEKLRLAKGRLKEWNLKEFGHIDHNIASLENTIRDFDQISNSRDLTNDEVSERRSAQNELWSWLKRKDMYWAQNSRAKWLKDGDRNTKYFHVLASIHKQKNTITTLFSNGLLIDDPTGIQAEAVTYFSDIFKEEFESRPIFEGLNFQKLSPEQSDLLSAQVSHSEIDEAVKSCNSEKAPGPDGYNFRFIKEAWEVLKSDIYSIVEEFWRSSRLPKGSNVAYIALIAKCENPGGLKDYRPISMVGCIYKIIAKILARRLQKVMDSLIGPYKSAFIAGR